MCYMFSILWLTSLYFNIVLLDYIYYTLLTQYILNHTSALYILLMFDKTTCIRICHTLQYTIYSIYVICTITI